MKEGNEPTRWRVLICICLKWQVREQGKGAAPWLGFSPLLLGMRVQKSSEPPSHLPATSTALLWRWPRGRSQAGPPQRLHANPVGACKLSLPCSKSLQKAQLELQLPQGKDGKTSPLEGCQSLEQAALECWSPQPWRGLKDVALGNAVQCGPGSAGLMTELDFRDLFQPRGYHVLSDTPWLSMLCQRPALKLRLWTWTILTGPSRLRIAREVVHVWSTASPAGNTRATHPAPLGFSGAGREWPKPEPWV